LPTGAVPLDWNLLLTGGGVVNAGVARARPAPARATRRAHGRGFAQLPRAESSRARLLAAAEQLVCTRGSEQLTATAVTAAARVSRSTFYATFADREDCLLALFDEVTDRLRAAMLAACAAETSWLDGVRAALCALLVSLDSRPNLARFLIVGGLSGESALVVRRRRVLADLAHSLEADSPDPPSLEAATPFGSQALVSGAASIIHSRLLEEPVPALLDLSRSLMAVLVMPFVGEGVARSELARTSAADGRTAQLLRRSDQASSVSASRVTHRTARVLTVIAHSPGVSNRSVAQKAGSIDEGQISKLLARLSALGLIVNNAKTVERRGSNAWYLTRSGSDLLAGLAGERAT
jgi:AcrR family transcriptional regulator